MSELLKWYPMKSTYGEYDSPNDLSNSRVVTPPWQVDSGKGQSRGSERLEKYDICDLKAQVAGNHAQACDLLPGWAEGGQGYLFIARSISLVGSVCHQVAGESGQEGARYDAEAPDDESVLVKRVRNSQSARA